MAESNQVLFDVSARVAAEFLMMNFEVFHRAAGLASPVIALEDLPVQSCVGFAIELQSSTLHQHLLQKTLPSTAERKASFCASGRNR